MLNKEARIEWMERMKEVQRFQYDYFKNLITLGTGSILILIAFLEKVFTKPPIVGIICIIISLIGFAGTIISSLLVLPNIGNIILYISGLQGATINNNKEQASDLQDKLQKAFASIHCLDRCSIFFYILGISTLLLFAIINLVF